MGNSWMWLLLSSFLFITITLKKVVKEPSQFPCISQNHLCGCRCDTALCFLSSASSEDRTTVWWEVLHRGFLRVSFWQHRGSGRPLQLLATHKSLLWPHQSWASPFQRTLHVDPLLQRRWAGRDWLPGPLQLYCRWFERNPWWFIDGNVLTIQSHWSCHISPSAPQRPWVSPACGRTLKPHPR